MNRVIIAALAALSSCNPALAQRAAVCPPNLSYCYEKRGDRADWEAFKAQLDADTAAVQYRLWRADAGLDRQLRRAQFCNSIRQDGC